MMKMDNNNHRWSSSGIRRRPQQQLSRELNYHPTRTTSTPHQRRKLTGYCGWKIWNDTTNSVKKKTCDQIAVELASDGTMQVAQAKSQILTQGCVCEVGETSFLDDSIIDLTAFCGQCQYKNANFACDDRVDFVMKNYPQDNPTKEQARMNLLKKGDCLDRNWAPYAQKMKNGGGGGGLTGGAIAGIVIAALALCAASIIGFCILRDWKKVMSDEEEDKKIQAAAALSANKKKNGLNVIEEGDEEEEDDEGESLEAADQVSSGAAAAPQSQEDGGGGMEDDQTEIIANLGKRGNEK